MAPSAFRSHCFTTTAGFLLACSLSASAAGNPPADSSLVWRWSALYLSRLDIVRSSERFPWNDEETRSQVNDRLAVLGDLKLSERFSVFAKGATGFRLGGDYQNEQFVLEEGHAGFELLRGSVRGRIFTRERVFRTENRLLEIVSNETAFLKGRGEGLTLEAKAGAHLRMDYTESILRGAEEIRKNGGLPAFQGGGDVFRVLSLGSTWSSRCHAALMLSQTRSTDRGDAVIVGANAGVRILGCDVMAELARTREGAWQDLRKSSLFDLRPDRFRFNDASSLFSEDCAFSAEADVPHLGMGRWGSAGIVPGYRFYGDRFADPAGETVAGLSETYAIAWWKPRRYDGLLSLEAADGSLGARSCRHLCGNVRFRYRGGFELREGIVCREGERCGAIVSFVDDNALSRLSMTARVDELGGGNELSFIAEGTANLGSSLAARSVLYLYCSRMSYYSVGVDFRPRERFLLRLAAGSFVPEYAHIMLEGALEPQPPRKDRSVIILARVWFGRM